MHYSPSVQENILFRLPDGSPCLVVHIVEILYIPKQVKLISNLKTGSIQIDWMQKCDWYSAFKEAYNRSWCKHASMTHVLPGSLAFHAEGDVEKRQRAAWEAGCSIVVRSVDRVADHQGSQRRSTANIPRRAGTTRPG